MCPRYAPLDEQGPQLGGVVEQHNGTVAAPGLEGRRLVLALGVGVLDLQHRFAAQLVSDGEDQRDVRLPVRGSVV